VLTSVLLLKDNNTIEHLAAPRLPLEYIQGINGLKIGPQEGSCGAAMSLKKTVITANIGNDPLWLKYKDFADRFNLKACWSLPIIHTSGKVMGSFAIYHKTPQDPTTEELTTVERLRNILRIVMENRWSLQEIKTANERFDIMMKATHDLIWDWDLETNTIYRDPLGLQQVYGTDNNEPIGSIQKWLERIHSEDHPRVEKTIGNILESTNENTFEVEYRFKRDDGTYAHVYDRGIIIRNENNKPLRMIGAAQDISERKQLEKELLNNELDHQRAINLATIETQEQERSEIGKELHDNVNQVLTTTKLYLDLALSNPELKDELIQKSTKNIINVINEIRQLSRSLMDPSIGDLGLIDSIHDLTENINLTRKLHVSLDVGEEIEDLLDKNQKLTIYRIIQEALNNAIKHAQATSVLIRILHNASSAEVIIEDDGVGFNVKTVKKGAGLKNMQNRIYLINGEHIIESTPNQGSKIIIKFPIIQTKNLYPL
jgi:PAS domain S-box-containing protein